MVEDFVEVLLSLMHNPQLEVYVSGSNSRFLSKDVATEFRGRGDEIRVWPLSFAEFYEELGGNRTLSWRNYYTYGGLPQVALLPNAEKKVEYLRNMYLSFRRPMPMSARKRFLDTSGKRRTHGR